MNYTVSAEGILITDTSSFNPEHIFECGQVFSYEKKGDEYYSFPGDKLAKIKQVEKGYFIETKDIDYFINYFDLDKDYNSVKDRLKKFPIMHDALKFGYGIRILNQDLFETLISFIISANNNIKRIKLILNNLRRAYGKVVADGIYAFPSYQFLKDQDEDFFKRMGAGYRAKYLASVTKQISPQQLEQLKKLPTKELRNKLISLSGVGPKVADCILLFGYRRDDVFPVDTWIHKCYNSFYTPTDNREKIRNDLISQFGELSGYAQQYLFYNQRSSLKA